jgi:hypothetical protein
MSEQTDKRTRSRAKQLLERSMFDLRLAGDAMKACGYPASLLDQLRQAWAKTRDVRKAVETSTDVCTEGNNNGREKR